MSLPTPDLVAPIVAAADAVDAGSSATYDVLIPLIPLLPILGFLFTALVGRRLGKQAHWVPVAMVVLSWLAAMVVVYAVLTGQPPFGEHGYQITLYTWIPAGSFQVDLGFYVDALTACLLIVVTTIGMLVHIYSIGYMAHDEGYWRFFAYLNLFMFSMLLLVLASSWLVVFVAWELVGLCSYLLIGFWYRKRSAALAAKKAFIVNRVGDVGFALGIMAIFATTAALGSATLDIQGSIGVLADASQAGEALLIPIGVIALLVFAGAVGKSAQFPLHVWLPDAMEGPTPVSALIHAATMVNAGVYLVARSNVLFSLSPDVMVIVAAIGIFTAILAASIAFTQNDIKRVLAYSTLSQLGYMFAALGVGAYIAAIFHLMAHGFFKGLLFLDSGSVIHAVHEEQDMRNMGGLSRKIRWTYATMLIGSLAIAGIPPLAGFFSKDEILAEAFKNGFAWVWIVGVIVALMTAFYMFRLMGMTFWGSWRGPAAVWDKIHESPWVMVVPLVLLALASIFIGMVLGLPYGDTTITNWLTPVFEESEVILGREAPTFTLLGVDGVLILISVTVAVLGMVAAWWLFGVRWLVFRRDPEPERVRSLAGANSLSRFLYRASLNKWWFDDVNDLLFIRMGGRVAAALWWFDREVVDGTVDAIGGGVSGAGRGLRRVQTGRVQNYALGIALGLLVMAGSYLLIVAR
jgi:NADH-quinone oxidoreductase subunit L